ncbi:hypothetical protein J6590_046597 [Homalodisca vitripennis]|nr:hypothetical protein J6590_046597 [Homalodisca vitripennis]
MERLVLIPKQGKREEFPPSYRPLRLLDNMGKLTEQLILILLKKELEEIATCNVHDWMHASATSAENEIPSIWKDYNQHFQRRSDYAACKYSIEEQDTIEHTIIVCCRWLSEREEMEP